jgi:hypothetical protein
LTKEKPSSLNGFFDNDASVNVNHIAFDKVEFVKIKEHAFFFKE